MEVFVLMLSSFCSLLLRTFQLLIIVKEVSYVNSFHPTLTNIPKTENLRKDPIGEIVSLHSCFHNTDCIRF